MISSQLWCSLVKHQIKQIYGCKICLELLHQELIRPLTFNKFLELVVKMRKKMMVKLKCKVKLRKLKHVLNKKLLCNKLKLKKLKRKKDTRKRKESKNKQNKKNSKDSNVMLRNKREECNNNSKWNKRK